MPIEICAVGGYNEVGKNCTAIKVDNNVLILDLGLHLENYIQYTDDEDIVSVDPEDLVKVGAVPDLSAIKDWMKLTKAIIPTHAHLDHVGGIPYEGNYFRAPIFCTPFTSAVLNSILINEKIKSKNQIKTLNINSHYQVSPDIKIEFINVTHSTPQTVMVAMHTRHGIILYANDFKFDRYPTLGQKPDFARLEELGKKGVYALICDSTYAASDKKMPSESVAKEMLRDVLLGTESKNNIIVVTTFSSHLARLKSIIEFGKKLNRKIVFLGRSLEKYVQAGEDVGLINFSKDVEIVKYGRQIRRRLKEIEKDREKYMLVVTGHQGEPKSTLSKMVRGVFKFRFRPEDHIVFSCTVIPSPTNIKNRMILEDELKHFNVRIFKDIHVSGHAAREDLRDLINLVKPKHIIPAHGEFRMTSALGSLASQMGYQEKKTVHVLHNGQHLKI
jgi:ribonuclease J